MAEFYSYGTAYTSTWYNTVSIASKEGAGITWYNKKIIFHPRFEIGIRVTIGDEGCRDNDSFCFDGFALVLSDKIQDVGGGGNDKGYGGLFNLLVSEFDFYKNPTDISSNSFSMHRCYNSYCSGTETSETSQVNLPFYYDKCKKYQFDVKLLYVDGNVKIYISDSLIFQANENLLEKFNGYGYFGVSGYFRGYTRTLALDLTKSYYTQDTIEKILFYSVVEGVRYENSLPTNIPAGSKIEVTCRFADLEHYSVPHYKEDQVTTWEFGISYSCKTPQYKSDFFIMDQNKIDMRNYVKFKKKIKDYLLIN